MRLTYYHTHRPHQGLGNVPIVGRCRRPSRWKAFGSKGSNDTTPWVGSRSITSAERRRSLTDMIRNRQDRRTLSSGAPPPDREWHRSVAYCSARHGCGWFYVWKTYWDLTRLGNCSAGPNQAALLRLFDHCQTDTVFDVGEGIAQFEHADDLAGQVLSEAAQPYQWHAADQLTADVGNLFVHDAAETPSPFRQDP